ncbi:MAG: TonB-dependent receptor, partial [Spirochaetia bacterium]|nr:TonB-dependent receptor [Spirochaetia bacterium]
ARGAKDIEGSDFQYSASLYYMKSQGPNFGDVQHLDPKRSGKSDVSYWLENKACGGACRPSASSTGYWWSDGFNVAASESYNVTARFSIGGLRLETINWQYKQGDGTFANGTQQIDEKGHFFKGSAWDFQNNGVAVGYLHKFTDKITLDSEVTARHTAILSSSHEEYPNVTTPDAYYRPGDTTSLTSYSRPDDEFDLREKFYWEQTARANLTMGLERSHFIVPRGYGDYRRLGYTNDAAYLQQVWSPWMWLTLTAGFRYDNNTIYGASQTPRISAVFRPADDLTFKALFSTGFRGPTALELYGETAQRRANPYLQPERLRSMEIGAAYRFVKRYYVSANAYCNKITELLLEVQTNEANPNSQSGANYNQNQNVGRAVICGAEVAADFQVSKQIKLFINYTYNSGRYEDLPLSQTSSPSTKGRPGDDMLFDAYAAAYKQAFNRDIVPETGPIPNIARNHANAGVTWYPVPSLSMHIRANYVDLRRTIATNPESTVKGYTMVDMNIRKEDFLVDRMFGQVLVNNVINEQYFDPGIRTATGGYYPTRHPLERRNIWLSLGYHF